MTRELMTAIGQYLAVAAGVLLATPALACSPAPMQPSTVAKKGEACSVTHTVSEYETAALSKVTRLEGGFLLQETYEGNACNGESSLVVTDCNSGEAMLLGPQIFDLMMGGTTGKMDELAEDLTLRAAAGNLTLDAAEKAGTKVGMPAFARAKTADRIKMLGRSFRLDCGCKLFYPGSPGAGG